MGFFNDRLVAAQGNKIVAARMMRSSRGTGNLPFELSLSHHLKLINMIGLRIK